MSTQHRQNNMSTQHRHNMSTQHRQNNMSTQHRHNMSTQHRRKQRVNWGARTPFVLSKLDKLVAIEEGEYMTV